MNTTLLVEAAQDFINKCDSGLARSKDSYKKFKEALASAPHHNKEMGGRQSHSYDELIGHQLDITAPKAVEIQIDHDHNNTIRVNVDGICVLRICKMQRYELNYNGQITSSAHFSDGTKYELGTND